MRGGIRPLVVFAFQFVVLASAIRAQTGGSGSIEGTVKDPSGSTVASATVEISNAVSGYSRTVTSGADGTFRVPIRQLYSGALQLGLFTVQVTAPDGRLAQTEFMVLPPGAPPAGAPPPGP